MTPIQKVIKVGAIIFAVVIIVNIFSAVIFGLTAFWGLFNFNNENNENIKGGIEFSENYSNIEKINLDLNISNLQIKKADSLKVEARNITDKFSAVEKNNELVIKDGGKKNILKKSVVSEIILYIPENTNFENMKIKLGIGNTKIENIKTNKLSLDAGIGNIQISNLESTQTNIDGGAGNLTIESGNINNLDCDSGVGEVSITSKITGNSKIDCGIGNVKLNLNGGKDIYSITTKKGLGNMSINNKKCSDDTTYGNGENRLKISGGVGNININFEN